MQGIKNFLIWLRVVFFFRHTVLPLIKSAGQRRWLKIWVTRISQRTGKRPISIWTDMLVKLFLNRADFWDYSVYELYSKSLKECRLYLTRGRYRRFYPFLTTKRTRQIMTEKPIFNKIFSEYLKREYLCISKDTRPEQISEFVLRHPVFIAKPINLRCGLGIELVDATSFASNKELLDYLNSKAMLLLEERVYNHEVLARFSTNSLNTLRIITVRLPEGVKIIFSALRFAKDDEVVDNINCGACPVDIESGRIFRGVTSFGNPHTCSPTHPSGFEVVGIEIPFWSEVKAMVKKAALQLEDVYFVPWDVAVTPNGPLIIEGNVDPGHRFSEITQQTSYLDVKGAYEYARRRRGSKLH
ncbi:MAG: hypothetical protein LBS74_03725 [Oscillospiraceae bacterium]|jgi:hypothetical protein|nr:hypothetical protein [Oscillospiraceae bacterium]